MTPNAWIAVATIVVLSMIEYGSATPKGQCPETGIVSLPHSRSCTKYYMCFNGKPMMKQCAEGLMYDHRQQNCQIEKVAKCQLDVCPVDPFGAVQMVAHPENCSKYFACSRGKGVEMTCAGTLLFNRKTGSCDLAERVKYCGEDHDPTEAPKTHCPSRGILKKIHATDCKKFYLCMDGREVTFKCTGELLYDVRTRTCNHPQISRCASHQKKP